MNRNPKEKTVQVLVRLKPKEKEKIKSIAAKCNLSVSEYIVKRALGYEPKTFPPDAFYVFNGKLSELLNRELSPKLESAALKLFDDIYAEIIDAPKQTARQIQREVITGSRKACFVGKRSSHEVVSLSALVTEAMNGV